MYPSQVILLPASDTVDTDDCDFVYPMCWYWI